MYKKDQYFERRKWLLKNGYNQFANPFLTKILLENWNLVEKVKKIIGPAQFYSDHYWYVWLCLVPFEDIIFKDVPPEEIKNLRDQFSAYGKNPEEVYQDPYFQENLRDFYVQWTAKKTKMLEATVVRLRETLILLATIIRGGTTGEHLGRTVCQEQIPRVRKEIKSPEDLHLISSVAEKFFLFDERAPCFVLTAVFEDSGYLFNNYHGQLFDTLFAVMKSYKSAGLRVDELGYALWLCLRDWRSFACDLSFTEKNLKRLIRVYKKWQFAEPGTEMDFFSFCQPISRLSKPLLEQSDIDLLLSLCEEITDEELLQMLLAREQREGVRQQLPQIIEAARSTKYPKLLFRSIMKMTGQRLSTALEHKTLLGYLEFNVSKYGPNIDVYEGNLISILPFLTNLNEVDYLWQVLGDFDTNLLASLFSVLKILQPKHIASFQTFIENGGKEVVQTLKDFNESPREELLNLCSKMVEKVDPSTNAEVIRIFNSCFRFMSAEVEHSRVKLRQMKYLDKISSSIFEHFGDYIINLMEQSPKNFMRVLFNIAHLTILNEDISRELLVLARACRSYRLFVSKGNKESLNPADIERVYLFLTSQLSKKPKNLDKLRKNIEKFNTQNEKSAFEYINKVLMDLSIEYFNALTSQKVRDAFEKYCGVPLPAELDNEEDITDVLQIAVKCHPGQNREPAKRLVQEICLKNTYPFKRLPQAYPYNQQANIEYMGKMKSWGIDMNIWVEGFKKEYLANLTDFSANTEKIIGEHREEIVRHFREAGLEVKEDEFDKRLTDLKDKQDLAKDIAGHLNAIKGLQGKTQFIQNARRVTVYTEQNPIKILQMGNVVGGSCLATDGSNSWTTVTNALDVNKRVLYCFDKAGDIMARRLIAMTNQGKIIQLGVYNNYPELDLDSVFEEYTLELAQRCGTTTANEANVNDRQDVATLLADRWYAGTPVIKFNSEHKTMPFKKAA
ncbi:MAG: hypothetical protein V1837_02475 [Candidatus Woesearchaeota archaeon]